MSFETFGGSYFEIIGLYNDFEESGWMWTVRLTGSLPDNVWLVHKSAFSPSRELEEVIKSLKLNKEYYKDFFDARGTSHQTAIRKSLEKQEEFYSRVGKDRKDRHGD